METFLTALVEGTLLGGVYALVALGLVVVFKATKSVNLAQGGILMFLAYFLWWLVDETGLPIVAGLLIFLVAAVVIGLGIDRFLVRPAVGRGDELRYSDVWLHTHEPARGVYLF